MIFTSLLAIVLSVSTPCQTEDSTNCRWDASTQGNGLGTSFIDVEGTAYYSTGLATSTRLGL